MAESFTFIKIILKQLAYLKKNETQLLSLRTHSIPVQIKIISGLGFSYTPAVWRKLMTFWGTLQYGFDLSGKGGTRASPGPNVSTTPITAMGCQQCLPLSVVQLKGKH